MEGHAPRTHSLRHLTSGSFGDVEIPRNQKLKELFAPHVDSFNYMVREGLGHAVQNIDPVELEMPNGDRIAVEIKEAYIGRPYVPETNRTAKTLQIFPAECRQRGATYAGRLKVNLALTVNGKPVDGLTVIPGRIPVMVGSMMCNLADCSTRSDFIQRGEEGDENGGYFIVNGNEKVIRLLVAQRRNYPLCLTRKNWVKRVKGCTKYGLQVRCVSADQVATTMVLHYLKSGSQTLCIAYHRELFFIPVMLIIRALVDFPDKYTFDLIMQGNSNDKFLEGNVVAMMREVLAMDVVTQTQAQAYLGKHFRVKLNCPDWFTDVEVGQRLLRRCVATHLSDFKEKYRFLIHMVQKLYAFVNDECLEESVDNPTFHEVLLGGHIYLALLKEKLETWLWGIREVIRKIVKNPKGELQYTLLSLTRNFVGMLDIGRAMEYFLATGNLVSRDALGLQQASGFAVLADRLNYARFVSHFRCIHRGAHFTAMRDPKVRYYKAEYVGFVCPVHTPDGPPCGLMNHLVADCKVVNTRFKGQQKLRTLLVAMGVISVNDVTTGLADDVHVVMLDGTVVGHASAKVLQKMAASLRHMKVAGHEDVPSNLEIVMIPPRKVKGQFPGLYLFSEVGRFIRPVKNLHHQKEELIGIFEQVYMGISLPQDDLTGKTHAELSEQYLMSVCAGMTPFCDHNPAPRNIYQCQMMKQTMGTPVHAFPQRADNKLYRLTTPQAPLVRTKDYTKYDMDQYCLGTNALVAVISYTGYDMEDALVINKASVERGLFHGSVYKSETINLRGKDKGTLPYTFAACPENRAVQDGFLDTDGLPPVGRLLQKGEPYYCVYNLETKEYKVHFYSKEEPAYVDQVKALGNDNGTCGLERVCIVLRMVRIPIIGDKFASRHGQKGTVSMLWPQEDMPYTENGLVPDVLFNPHGFPSRMTIGMLIESLAGKSACIQGHCYDATAFSTNEDNPHYKIFGECLLAAGYNYYGREQMYSGITGTCMEVGIFFGPIHYQRLRHMVNDKCQVRTVGMMDNLTQQPVKGRKRGGGVRFGEMERDALIASGCSSILNDRLLQCSDATTMMVCTKCGGTDSNEPFQRSEEEVGPKGASARCSQQQMCMRCLTKGSLKTITIPYVMKYLISELVAMNIDPQTILGRL